MAKITKEDFIAQLKEIGYDKKDSAMFLEDIWELIAKNLEKGNTVEFRGYCKFEPLFRRTLADINKVRGEEVKMKECYVMKMTAGRCLKMAVRAFGETQKEGANGKASGQPE